MNRTDIHHRAVGPAFSLPPIFVQFEARLLTRRYHLPFFSIRQEDRLDLPTATSGLLAVPHVQIAPPRRPKGQGLGLQILASWLDIQGYTLTVGSPATWARRFNQHLSHVIESHPGRFRGLATVPIQDGELAARDLDYAVNQLGFPRAMLATDPVEQDLSRDSFDPRWSAAEELGVPLVLHPPAQGFGANIPPWIPGLLPGPHPGHHHHHGQADTDRALGPPPQA